MGDRHRLLVTLGDVVATERKTRRVEMGKALINGFLTTHREGDLAQEQVTAIGVHLIEGATQFEAIEHGGVDAGTKEQIEGRIGKELRGQGQRSIGKPSAIENHPRGRFPWGDLLLVVRLETSVDHAHESSIFDHRGNQPQVI